MIKEEAKELILRYNCGRCTADEKQLVDNWYEHFAIDENSALSEQDFADLNHEIWACLPKEVKTNKHYGLWQHVAAAASIVLIFGASIYIYTSLHYTKDKNSKQLVSLNQDIPPGKNTASLTFANGKTIKLSQSKTGVIINTKALKYNDGTLVTSSNSNKLLPAANMLTVSTPNGGTYQVILPDGSNVYLNAASVIKFSSDFASKTERRIDLSGEAYFEVAKNKHQPFIVKCINQEIKVLGTHFNVNAYQNEPYSKTTLLQGSILINHTILKPNQQALQLNGKIKIDEVNASDAIDWKNGEFICKNEPLEHIMRKIARWYDVDVIYNNLQTKKITFSGSLSRYANVTDILKAIEFTGTVKFKLENRKITVL